MNAVGEAERYAPIAKYPCKICNNGVCHFLRDCPAVADLQRWQQENPKGPGGGKRVQFVSYEGQPGYDDEPPDGGSINQVRFDDEPQQAAVHVNFKKYIKAVKERNKAQEADRRNSAKAVATIAPVSSSVILPPKSGDTPKRYVGPRPALKAVVSDDVIYPPLSNVPGPETPATDQGRDDYTENPSTWRVNVIGVASENDESVCKTCGRSERFTEASIAHLRDPQEQLQRHINTAQLMLEDLRALTNAQLAKWQKEDRTSVANATLRALSVPKTVSTHPQSSRTRPRGQSHTVRQGNATHTTHVHRKKTWQHKQVRRTEQQLMAAHLKVGRLQQQLQADTRRDELRQDHHRDEIKTQAAKAYRAPVADQPAGRADHHAFRQPVLLGTRHLTKPTHAQSSAAEEQAYKEAAQTYATAGAYLDHFEHKYVPNHITSSTLPATESSREKKARELENARLKNLRNRSPPSPNFRVNRVSTADDSMPQLVSSSGSDSGWDTAESSTDGTVAQPPNGAPPHKTTRNTRARRKKVVARTLKLPNKAPEHWTRVTIETDGDSGASDCDSESSDAEPETRSEPPKSIKACTDSAKAEESDDSELPELIDSTDDSDSSSSEDIESSDSEPDDPDDYLGLHPDDPDDYLGVPNIPRDQEPQYLRIKASYIDLGASVEEAEEQARKSNALAHRVWNPHGLKISEDEIKFYFEGLDRERESLALRQGADAALAKVLSMTIWDGVSNKLSDEEVQLQIEQTLAGEADSDELGAKLFLQEMIAMGAITAPDDLGHLEPAKVIGTTRSDVLGLFEPAKVVSTTRSDVLGHLEPTKVIGTTCNSPASSTQSTKAPQTSRLQYHNVNIARLVSSEYVAVSSTSCERVSERKDPNWGGAQSWDSDDEDNYTEYASSNSALRSEKKQDTSTSLNIGMVAESKESQGESMDCVHDYIATAAFPHSLQTEDDQDAEQDQYDQVLGWVHYDENEPSHRVDVAAVATSAYDQKAVTVELGFSGNPGVMHKALADTGAQVVCVDPDKLPKDTVIEPIYKKLTGFKQEGGGAMCTKTEGEAYVYLVASNGAIFPRSRVLLVRGLSHPIILSKEWLTRMQCQWLMKTEGDQISLVCSQGNRVHLNPVTQQGPDPRLNIRVATAVPDNFLDEEADAAGEDQVLASIHTTRTITLPPRAVTEVRIPVSKSVQ
jgi:hypothetical protein